MVVWVILGAVLVAVAVGEVLVTVLHPEARGPITARLEEAVWRVIQVGDRRTDRGLSRVGGPVAITAGVGSWVVAIWFGFGLIWLGTASAIDAPSTGIFEDSFGLVDALYFSGSVLTTIGFGDVVASGGATRLVAVFEGAVGLGVLSALISYVLSLYPLVTEKRVIASRLLDLGVDRPTGALELTYGRGWIALDRLHSELIESNQNLRRFHVLYYFHASRYEEELTPLVRSAHLALVCLRLRSADPSVAAVTSYVEPLERACERFRTSTAADFRIPEGEPHPRQSSESALRELHAHALECWPERIAAEPDFEEILDEIETAERYLAGLADVHCYEFTPLLSEERAVLVANH